MDSSRSPRLLQGVSWVLSANAIYLVVSAVLTLVLPKFICPLEFGWWQLYQLFALYFGYVTFGYTDGVNLRFAGLHFSELPRRQLSTGLMALTAMDAVVFGLIALGVAMRGDEATATIVGLAALGALAYVPRTLASVVLQSTRRVRSYSTSIAVERLVLVLGVALLVARGHDTAVSFVLADVFSKVFGLILTLAISGGIEWVRWDLSSQSLGVFFADCRVGLFVLFANLSAMLTQGLARFWVLLRWDIIVFGQVSLGLQLASMFMVAVNAVAVTILPNLKLVSVDRYGSVYASLRRKLVSPVILGLALCFPMVALVNWWLPNYGSTGLFAALLFPICIYEALSRGVTGVFLKALRRERVLLIANFVGLIVATLFALLGVATRSLEMVLISIVLGSAARALAGEVVIARALGVSWWKSWVIDSGIVVVFTACILADSPHWTILAFYLVLLIYAGYHLKDQDILGPVRRRPT